MHCKISKNDISLKVFFSPLKAAAAAAAFSLASRSTTSRLEKWTSSPGCSERRPKKRSLKRVLKREISHQREKLWVSLTCKQDKMFKTRLEISNWVNFQGRKKTNLCSPYALPKTSNIRYQNHHINLRIWRFGVATAKKIAQRSWRRDLGISWVKDHANILCYNSRLNAVIKLREKTVKSDCLKTFMPRYLPSLF